MPWNKRTQKRRPLYYYLPVLNNEDDSLVGRVGDITTEGVMLLTPSKMAVGTELSLSIILSPDVSGDAKEITVRARTQWSRPDFNPEITLIGLQFVDISAQVKAQIESLILAIGMSSDEFEEEMNAN
jgi:c-di-GMP-binding flagellar brake protein YcgR